MVAAHAEPRVASGRLLDWLSRGRQLIAGAEEGDAQKRQERLHPAESGWGPGWKGGERKVAGCGCGVERREGGCEREAGWEVEVDAATLQHRPWGTPESSQPRAWVTSSPPATRARFATSRIPGIVFLLK